METEISQGHTARKWQDGSNPPDLVLLGISWKKTNFQWQGVGAG